MLTFVRSRRARIPVLVLPAVSLIGSMAACAPRSGRVTAAADDARPGQPCGAGPVDNLLTPRWQQCWFMAAGGRWRTLKHDLHYDSMVVDVEAANLEDAQAIAQRFIDNQPRFRYLTLYAYEEPSAAPGPVRRVSWDREGGFEFLDYDLSMP